MLLYQTANIDGTQLQLPQGVSVVWSFFTHGEHRVEG